MSEHSPVTSPPRRCQDHSSVPPGFNVSSSESCKNTPNIGRKHENLAHCIMLKSGSQSAHNSPLPHRRLDKLEGVIRDKPSPLSTRRLIEGDDSSSVELSPPVPRKITIKPCACTHGVHLRHREVPSNLVRTNTECSHKPKVSENSIDSPRRRVESDCSCLKGNQITKTLRKEQSNECNCPVPNLAQKSKRKELFSSPAKSIGEPGVFSSPIHRFEPNSFAVLGSPAKSIIGEPGVFASPARSICTSPSPSDEKEKIAEEDIEIQPKPDQTVVSGWLKFRDNKRWKIRWGVVTKLSPAADCLHLQLYRDSKDRYKQGQTKASLSLQQFLGIETGFTLDKESNTIAIICQDVIVVLAFDTRERLMQWQVKISNHLGEGIQYLVLVSSAPSKSKTQTGPARMHIQDHRFCLTTGVPPKLSGLWDIAYLRRYGVVDNRFCFEGGSRCGKGEGLYVFVTDQGEDITQALKLASQGRLSVKKRQLARKVLTLDSPRRILSPRPMESEGDGYSCHIDDSSCTCGSRTPFWPSQESRDVDYGCGDTASVSECHDSFNDGEIFPKNPTANLERCMSCISKLGAPSMSRSSTATGNATPGGTQPPLWTILTEQSNPNNISNKAPIAGVDRMSICSSHGSSGGYVSSGGSEYSVPRMTSTMATTGSYADSCYESIPVITNCCAKTPQSSMLPCHCHSQRHCQPKINDRNTKPAMPLPIINPLHEGCITRQPTGAYENYDIPKTPVPLDHSTGSENYDKPKNIQEYLSEDLNKNPMSFADSYGNYDTPTQTGNVCGCLVSQEPPHRIIEGGRSSCTCNRVMSWADNWISIPYCRRGNGIENTGMTINRVKLSGEGKMPVVNQSGELAVYATVDLSKKTNRRLEDKSCDCSTSSKDTDSNFSNYINLDPSHVLKETTPEVQPKTETSISALYTNLDFAQSLENYENSKEVLQKAGVTTSQHVCLKCGHCSEKPPEIKVTSQPPEPEQPTEYLKLDTEKMDGSNNFSGYLPMSPAAPVTTVANTAPPLPSKCELLKRIIGEKSASNPSLAGPAVDRNRKRTEQNRVPGSAMMVLHRTGSSPYNRKQIMDNSDLLPTDKRFAMRKRSSSADSSRFFEDCEDFDSSETLRKSSITETSGRRSSSPCLHQETESCTEDVSYTKRTETEDESSVTSTSQSQNSQSVHIRRSASVPCKAQNRDSSSSNDSGVSTGSLRHRVGDFHEFELPLTTALSARRHQRHIQPYSTCVHATLPRRSKSFDPLRDISFQFQKIELPGKSTSAEAEVPICPPKGRGFVSPCEGVSLVGPPYVDSRSTSSGTSDMSDYIETLSLSSHGSSDAPENIRLLRQATSTLRPRSGKEYQNIDRSHLSVTQGSETAKIHGNPPPLRGLLSCTINYANITPVPENAESPSPGYQSGGSTQESHTDSFMFKNELQTKQLSTGNNSSVYN